MRRYLLFSLFIFFILFLAGCTFKKSQYLGCCELINRNACSVLYPHYEERDNPDYENYRECAASPPPPDWQCNALKGAAKGIEQPQQNYPREGVVNTCDTEKELCDLNLSVRYSITKPDGSNDVATINNVSVPICSNLTSFCTSGDCHAQVCGPFKYTPTPIPGLGDIMNIRQNERDISPITNSVGGEGSTQQLYGAQCQVLKMDVTLQNYFTNAKGSFINTFRFGVGETFDQFELYRFLFPISDNYCNVNPLFGGGKDRYLNYMVSPDEYAQLASGGALSFKPPENKTQDETFCPKSMESAWLSPIYGGLEYPYYKTVNITREQYATVADRGNRDLDVPQDPYLYLDPPAIPKSTFSYNELDKNFYAQFLPFVYRKQLEESLRLSNGTPAPFECENALQCSSGNCNLIDYSRGICKQANKDNWVECDCSQNDRKCLSIRTDRDPSWNDYDDADGLKNRVNAYLNGQNYSTRVYKPVIVNKWRWDPNCEDIGEEKWTKVTDQCTLLGDNSWTCKDTEKQYLYTCDRKLTCKSSNEIKCTVSEASATCNGEIIGSNVNCAYEDNEIDCPASNRHDAPPGAPRITASCTPPEGDRVTCTTPQTYCSGSSGNSVYSCITKVPPTPPGIPGAPATFTCKIGASNVDMPATCDATGVCQITDPVACTASSDNHTEVCDYQSAGAADNHVICSGTDYKCPKEANPEDGTEWKCGEVTVVPEKTQLPKDLQGVFHTEIRFFPQSERANGKDYIGYTFLDEQNFLDTDFARNCGIVKPSGPEGSPYYEVPNSSYNPATFHGNPRHHYMHEYELMPGLLGEGNDIIPSYVGVKTESMAVCHWDGDDNGWGYAAANLILLKKPPVDANQKGSFGICEYDGTTNMVTSKLFGWCEGCSFATLAKQTIKTLEPIEDTYWPRNASLARKTTREIGDGTYTEVYADPTIDSKILSSCYQGDVTQACYDIDYNVKSGAFYTSLRYFDTIPDAMFVREKLIKHMKDGVLPVLDATDPSNWAELENDRGKSHRLRQLHETPFERTISDFLVTKGPAMVIVDRVAWQDLAPYGNPAINQRLYNRLTMAKGFCPKCMVGFQVSNGNPGFWEGGGNRRVIYDQLTLRIINDTDFGTNPVTGNPRKGAEIFDNANFIAYELYPHEFNPSEHPIEGYLDGLSCDKRPELNQAILDNMTGLGRSTLANYHLPSIFASFYIDDSNDACWGMGEDKRGNPMDKKLQFLSFLFTKHGELAKNGVMGIIYSNVSKLETPDPGPEGSDSFKYSEQFCALQEASRNMVGDKPITIYSKIYTTKRDDTTCLPCTNFDIALGKCSNICTDGTTCHPPDLSEGEAAPPGYKCPPKGLPEPCRKCSASNGAAKCNFVYADGSKDSVSYEVNKLNDLSPDIIASLPYGSTCCLRDQVGNYSYFKEVSQGKSTAPMMFSFTDPNQDCGNPDIGALDPQVCGGPSLIKNYKVSCDLVEGAAPAPPPGMGVAPGAGGGLPGAEEPVAPGGPGEIPAGPGGEGVPGGGDAPKVPGGFP